MYLNSRLEEKLQIPQWLISATLLKFNHLRGIQRETLTACRHDQVCPQIPIMFGEANVWA
jgi:hypothetical protein